MGVEDYHVIELVGEGSFGKVYKGRRKFTGQVCSYSFLYIYTFTPYASFVDLLFLSLLIFASVFRPLQ